MINEIYVPVGRADDIDKKIGTVLEHNQSRAVKESRSGTA